MIKRFVDWLVDLWLQKCIHSPENIAADILEGSSSIEVKYCRRCGAVRISYQKQWRRPRPLWFA
jgi:hypothetical protein